MSGMTDEFNITFEGLFEIGRAFKLSDTSISLILSNHQISENNYAIETMDTVRCPCGLKSNGVDRSGPRTQSDDAYKRGTRISIKGPKIYPNNGFVRPCKHIGSSEAATCRSEQAVKILVKSPITSKDIIAPDRIILCWDFFFQKWVATRHKTRMLFFMCRTLKND